MQSFNTRPAGPYKGPSPASRLPRAPSASPTRRTPAVPSPSRAMNPGTCLIQGAALAGGRFGQTFMDGRSRRCCARAGTFFPEPVTHHIGQLLSLASPGCRGSPDSYSPGLPGHPDPNSATTPRLQTEQPAVDRTAPIAASSIVGTQRRECRQALR
jgi:hypothetical protein